MRKEIVQVTLPICGAILIGGAWLANAGSLTPPSGAVSATGRFGPRTEITSLPFTISTAGSYYLGQNLSSAGAGITIDINDVTLDLNGFTLTGGTGDGIAVTGSRENIEVKNGIVRGWTGGGINLGGAVKGIVERVRTSNNGAAGIQLGENMIALTCVSSNNIVGIIAIGSGCLIKDSVVRQNATGCGIQANLATIANCVSYNNVRGFNGTGNTITNCNAINNANEGFSAAESVIQGCVARGNLGNGISATSSLVIGNVAINNSPNDAVLTTSTNVNNHGF